MKTNNHAQEGAIIVGREVFMHDVLKRWLVNDSSTAAFIIA
jgi:hypothetical protein